VRGYNVRACVRGYNVAYVRGYNVTYVRGYNVTYVRGYNVRACVRAYTFATMSLTWLRA
jgi:hypothetical protein